MKCVECKKEIGTNTICQHCGKHQLMTNRPLNSANTSSHKKMNVTTTVITSRPR